VGTESPLKHGLRLKLLLAPLKLRSWPYSGAIVVEETSALGVRHWHVVEGWQYLGTVVAGVDDDELPKTTSIDRQDFANGFDADVYRILCRHIKPQARNLRPWPPRA
jgi:DNA polymerase-3 subunit epsilon